MNAMTGDADDLYYDYEKQKKFLLAVEWTYAAYSVNRVKIYTRKGCKYFDKYRSKNIIICTATKTFVVTARASSGKIANLFVYKIAQ